MNSNKLKLKVLTVATHDAGYFSALKLICEKNKIDLEILGWNKKWQGWNWRNSLIEDRVKELINQNYVLMIIDGFDVLILDTEKEIIKKFKNFNCDIIFSISCDNSQPTNSKFFRYITTPIISYYFNVENAEIKNAGCFLGLPKTILKLFELTKSKSKFNKETDDQILLNSINHNLLNSKNDKFSKIFWIWEISSIWDYLNMYFTQETKENISDFIYLNGKIKFYNGNMPSVVHGVSNRIMDELVKNIGRELNIESLKNFKNSSPNWIQQKDVRYFLYILRTILVVVLMVIFYKVSKKIPKFMSYF